MESAQRSQDSGSWPLGIWAFKGKELVRESGGEMGLLVHVEFGFGAEGR